jgi:hypothetical protein
MEVLFRRFLWEGGNNTRRKLHLISWEKLAKPFSKGSHFSSYTGGHFSSYTNPIRLLPSYAEMPSYTSLFHISHCKKGMPSSLHKV